jgi:hypothetical protein
MDSDAYQQFGRLRSVVQPTVRGSDRRSARLRNPIQAIGTSGIAHQTDPCFHAIHVNNGTDSAR